MNSCFVDLLARQLYSWGKNVLLHCLKCTQKSALLSRAKSTHSNAEESNLPARITLHNVDGWMAIAWQLFQLQIQSNPKAHRTRVNTLYDGEMEEVRERKRCVKAVWNSHGCECLTSTHKVNTDSPATNASVQFRKNLTSWDFRNLEKSTKSPHNGMWVTHVVTSPSAVFIFYADSSVKTLWHTGDATHFAVFTWVFRQSYKQSYLKAWSRTVCHWIHYY